MMLCSSKGWSHKCKVDQLRTERQGGLQAGCPRLAHSGPKEEPVAKCSRLAAGRQQKCRNKWYMQSDFERPCDKIVSSGSAFGKKRAIESKEGFVESVGNGVVPSAPANAPEALKSIIAVRRQGLGNCRKKKSPAKQKKCVNALQGGRQRKRLSRHRRHGLHAGHSKFDDGQTFTPGRLFNFFLL